MLSISSLITAGRIKTVLGLACAVLCFGTGYKIKALSADKMVAEIKSDYAIATAEAMEDANKRLEEGLEQYKREVEALQRAIATREADLNTLRLSRSDLVAQLDRLHSTIRELNSREVPKAVSKAGDAYNACWRAVNDLRRVAAAGAKLHGEGAELLGELTDELGQIYADRKAITAIINSFRPSDDQIE